jgi:hypothetical protein
MIHELQGALEASAPERGETHLAWLDAHVRWSALGVQGSLTGWIRDTEERAFVVELATFGARCADGYGFAIEPEQALPNGLRPQDALDALQTLTQVDAQWQDGALDTFALSFAYAAGSACARLSDRQDDAVQGTVRLAGTLSLTAASGRLDGDWPISVSTTVADEGGEPTLRLGLAQELQARPDELESDWGIFGISADAFDMLTLQLEATLAPVAGGAALSGELALTGYELPEMVPQDRPLSSADLRATELLRVLLGGAAR